MEISRSDLWKSFERELKDTLIFLENTVFGVDEDYFRIMMESLQNDLGFTLIEGEEDTGVILYSPEAQEIYREIPKSDKWMFNVLKSCYQALQYLISIHSGN